MFILLLPLSSKHYPFYNDGTDLVPSDILEMPITDEWTESLNLVTVDAETGETLELTYPINPYLLPINPISGIASDARPVLIEGTLFLPLRQMTDRWGWDIQWNDADKSIKITTKPRHYIDSDDDDYNEVLLNIGQKSVEVNRLNPNYTPNLLESRIETLTTPPCLINGTAMVSTDFMFECLMCHVVYSYPEQTVNFHFINQLKPVP